MLTFIGWLVLGLMFINTVADIVGAKQRITWWQVVIVLGLRLAVVTLAVNAIWGL